MHPIILCTPLLPHPLLALPGLPVASLCSLGATLDSLALGSLAWHLPPTPASPHLSLEFLHTHILHFYKLAAESCWRNKTAQLGPHIFFLLYHPPPKNTLLPNSLPEFLPSPASDFVLGVETKRGLPQATGPSQTSLPLKGRSSPSHPVPPPDTHQLTPATSIQQVHSHLHYPLEPRPTFSVPHPTASAPLTL